MRTALVRVDLAAFVATFRAAAALSQMELGNLVDGWSQSLVSLTERGLRDTLYDIRKLLAFADTVGMPRIALAPLILGRPDAVLNDVGDVGLGRRYCAPRTTLSAVVPCCRRRCGISPMPAGCSTRATTPQRSAGSSAPAEVTTGGRRPVGS